MAPSIISSTISVKPDGPPASRAFFTNGDLVRGRVMLDVVLPADQQREATGGQLKAEGEVKVSYGWEVTQAEASPAGDPSTDSSPKLETTLLKGTTTLSSTTGRPDKFSATWFFEFHLPASSASGLPDQPVKGKGKGKASALVPDRAGPSSFDDGVLRIEHLVHASADLTVTLPKRKVGAFGFKSTVTDATSVEAREAILFRIKPSSVVLSPQEVPAPLTQAFNIPLSTHTGAAGKLNVVLTPPVIPVPTGSEFVPVKLKLSYERTVKSSSGGGWSLFRGKAKEEQEEAVRLDRFLLGTLEGSINVWTSGRERLVVVPFKPLTLDIFSDDPRLAATGEGLEVSSRLRYIDNLPPDARGIDSGSFKTAVGGRTFDLSLQLVFATAADAPCVPTPLTLCKGTVELPFVAPFLPTFAGSNTPLESITPLESPSLRSSGSRSPIGRLPERDGKALPPLPLLNGGSPPASPVPSEWAERKAEEAAVERRLAERRKKQGEAPPPAYDQMP